MCWWARGDKSTGGGDGGQVLWKTGWMLAMVEAAVAVVDRVRRVIVVRILGVRWLWWRIVGAVPCSMVSRRVRLTS